MNFNRFLGRLCPLAVYFISSFAWGADVSPATATASAPKPAPATAPVPVAAPAVSGIFKVLGMGCRESGLFYFSDGLPRELSVYNSDISRGYPYRGPQQLAIFRKGPPDMEGNPTWIKVGEGRFPANVQRALFLLMPQKGAVPYALVALPLDASASANRSLMIFNLSHVLVAGQFGKEVFQLEPMKSKKMNFPRVRDKDNDDVVMLRLAADFLGEWDIIYSKPFFAQQGRRSWIFIVDVDGTRSKLQVCQFMERLEKAPNPSVPKTTGVAPAGKPIASIYR